MKEKHKDLFDSYSIGIPYAMNFGCFLFCSFMAAGIQVARFARGVYVAQGGGR